MKYCTLCGSPMDDNANFCQSCGMRFSNATNQAPVQYKPVTTKPRPVMKYLSIFCFVGVAVMLFGFFYAQMTPLIFGAVFYGIFGVMFSVLSKTPKKSTYIMGKATGIKTGLFVFLCVAAAILAIGLAASNTCIHDYQIVDSKIATCTQSGEKVYICTLCNQQKIEDSSPIGHTYLHGFCTKCGKKESDTIGTNGGIPVTTPAAETTPLTMKDIEEWYIADMPYVCSSLTEYAQTKVKGLSNFNITETKFFFGDNYGWIDCNYTLYISCKVNGIPCIGEARAFREYKSDELYWFHFEIVKDSDWGIIIEEYDENCDAMMEEHYNYLVSLLK